MVFGKFKKQKPLEIVKKIRNGTRQNFTAFLINSYCMYVADIEIVVISEMSSPSAPSAP